MCCHLVSVSWSSVWKLLCPPHICVLLQYWTSHKRIYPSGRIFMSPWHVINLVANGEHTWVHRSEKHRVIGRFSRLSIPIQYSPRFWNTWYCQLQSPRLRSRTRLSRLMYYGATSLDRFFFCTSTFLSFACFCLPDELYFVIFHTWYDSDFG